MKNNKREALIISERTKDGLRQAKLRGVRLGSPNPSRGAARAAEVNREKADSFAKKMRPVILQIQESGTSSLRGIANMLNSRGLRSARNKNFSPQTVSDLISRSLFLDRKPEIFNKKEPSEAVIYCRCSTSGQAMGGSLRRQLEWCFRYASEKKYRPIAVFSEIASAYEDDLPIRDVAFQMAERRKCPVIFEAKDRVFRGSFSRYRPQMIAVLDDSNFIVNKK